jgi:spore maturation protein SpmB
LYFFRPRPPADLAPAAPPPTDLPDAKLPGLDAPSAGASPWRVAFVGGVVLLVFWGLLRQWAEHAPEVGTWPFLRDTVLQHWLLPLLILGFVAIGILGRVRVYDVLIEGSKEGLAVAARIAPYLVAILVAVAMFRASGALEMLVGALDPFTSAVGFPAEALPMALLRPLSGSGAFAVMAEAVKVYGPDSFVGLLICTLQGSTETTFYVLAVYFGAAGITRYRHALPAALLADLAGMTAAVVVVRWLFT